jgi:hypothetical protein
MFCTLNGLFQVILHVQVEGTILCADEGLRPLLQKGIRQNNRDGRFCLQGMLIFLQSLRDASFNKDLSNEPIFGRIHLAGQYL